MTNTSAGTVAKLMRLAKVIVNDEEPFLKSLKKYGAKAAAANAVSATQNRRFGDHSFEIGNVRWSTEMCGVGEGRTNFSLGLSKLKNYVGFDGNPEHAFYIFWCYDAESDNKSDRIYFAVNAQKLKEKTSSFKLIDNKWFLISPQEMAKEGLPVVGATNSDELARLLVEYLETL